MTHIFEVEKKGVKKLSRVVPRKLRGSYEEPGGGACPALKYQYQYQIPVPVPDTSSRYRTRIRQRIGIGNWIRKSEIGKRKRKLGGTDLVNAKRASEARWRICV